MTNDLEAIDEYNQRIKTINPRFRNYVWAESNIYSLSVYGRRREGEYVARPWVYSGSFNFPLFSCVCYFSSHLYHRKKFILDIIHTQYIHSDHTCSIIVWFLFITKYFWIWKLSSATLILNIILHFEKYFRIKKYLQNKYFGIQKIKFWN